jgi:hypothetical protein
MAQHPELADLAFVLGEWTGHGRGRYPTVESFEYRETVTFSAPPGKPFIAYQQKTRVEMVLAQPTGLVEVLHGTVESGSIALRSTSVERTSTAKEVSTVERNLTVDGDMLRYELLMGAVGQPHQLHLEASLDRQA